MRNVRESGGEGMERMSVGAKMRRVRAQAMLVHRLGEQLRALEPGVKSPVLTDMPRYSGGMAKGIDCQMARKDALERILLREGALMREYESAARAEMDRMKPELYAFCTLYYLSGMTMEETAETLGRCVRQCTRYKKEIESEEGDGEKDRASENVAKSRLVRA